MSMDVAAGALEALALSQQVAAHNLANVNTEGFRASRATLEERPELGGAAVQEVRETSAPAPLVPSMRLVEQGGRVEQERSLVEGSTTDPAREMASLTVRQRAFEANAAVVRAEQQMVGVILDMVA